MKDPYKVLGVPPDASDDEIKKAYRALARKYHPDNYNGSDLADLAEEKMKEVNEAYDAVKKMRETGQSYSGQSSSSSSSGGYSGGLAEARRLIAAGSYANAELILDSISVNEFTDEFMTAYNRRFGKAPRHPETRNTEKPFRIWTFTPAGTVRVRCAPIRPEYAMCVRPSSAPTACAKCAAAI